LRLLVLFGLGGVWAVACGGPQSLGSAGSVCFRADECQAGLACVPQTVGATKRVCSADLNGIVAMVDGSPLEAGDMPDAMSGAGTPGTSQAGSYGTAGQPSAGAAGRAAAGGAPGAGGRTSIAGAPAGGSASAGSPAGGSTNAAGSTSGGAPAGGSSNGGGADNGGDSAGTGG